MRSSSPPFPVIAASVLLILAGVLLLPFAAWDRFADPDAHPLQFPIRLVLGGALIVAGALSLTRLRHLTPAPRPNDLRHLALPATLALAAPVGTLAFLKLFPGAPTAAVLAVTIAAVTALCLGTSLLTTAQVS